MATSQREGRYCTFWVDDLFLGIEVLKVQEVIRAQPMTRVPLAPGVIAGLINLRGQIVTAIDLRARLELPPRTAGLVATNVVLQTDDGAVSLLVDEIGDVVEVPETAFERTPSTVVGITRDLIPGAFKIQDQLLLVLDTERTLYLGADAVAAEPAR
jgi:purine-binding chemotaxis protein CheW